MSETNVADVPELRSLLAERFGFTSFRPGQEAVVAHVHSGRNALVMAPTGGGKSLCYQIPALSRQGVGIVVSPLIALMADQVKGLLAKGIRAVDASARGDLGRRAATDGKKGVDLIYVSPEMFVSSTFVDYLKKAEISVFAVDEAHCVVQWGRSFRESYLRLADVMDLFPTVPRVAMTASADPSTRDEICHLLRMDPAKRFVTDFDRPNIDVSVVMGRNVARQVIEYAEARRGTRGAVFCGTRAETSSTWRSLLARGIDAVEYHAGMEPAERKRSMDAFVERQGVVVAATVAFGMGVDVPDVRWVVHTRPPASIEQWYQEIGRAGRDGRPSEAVAFVTPDDISRTRALLRLEVSKLRTSGLDDRHASDAVRRFEAVVAFTRSVRCRRANMLGLLGGRLDAACGGCDRCRERPRTLTATASARSLCLAARASGGGYGAAYLADMALGVPTPRIVANGHVGAAGYGGARGRRADVLELLEILIVEGLLDRDDRGGIAVTAAAAPLLRAATEFEIVADDAGWAGAGALASRRPAERAMPAMASVDRRLAERVAALGRRPDRDRLAEVLSGTAYEGRSDELVELVEPAEDVSVPEVDLFG